MPRTRQSWIILTIVVALTGALWIASTRVQAGSLNAGAPPAPEKGYPAPDFTLVDHNGELLSLSDLRGRPVMVNFWATWCPPCRAEIPALEEVSRELDGRVVILGVNVQESPVQVVPFIQEYGVTYPVVFDEDAQVARAYRVRAYPTSFFIDAQGIVTDIYAGPLNEPLLYTRMVDLVGR